MFKPDYGAVYGSAIFKFSADRIARFLEQFRGAVIGGTGTCFTQRGCHLACKFRVVPGKEGKPRPVAGVADIWRGERWPKHLHLLDNDFFGEPSWPDRIAEIRAGGFKVSFTQGINVRAMTPEVAAAIASVEYRDDEFRRQRLYTARDNLKDEEMFFRGVDMLEAAGVPPSTSWPSCSSVSTRTRPGIASIIGSIGWSSAASCRTRCRLTRSAVI